MSEQNMKKKKTRIVLVDDHVMIRQALSGLLSQEPDLEVVGEAENGREGVRMARELRPDLVIMDVSIPDLNGIEATRQIIKARPETNILALSMYSEKKYVDQIFQAGAKGYLLKEGDKDELLNAVRIVASGRPHTCPAVTDILLQGYLGGRPSEGSRAYTEISHREREVLQLLAEGHSTKVIAEKLNISRSTVETHRRQVKIKLNLPSQTDLVKFAIREGLITLE